MRIYCQNRLENIYDNVNAIIKRLKSLKPSKKKGGKKKVKKTETDDINKVEDEESNDTEVS